MREEILYGLKNAMQRGTPVELAMQSFINAGYSEADVKEAGESLMSGTGSVTEIIRVMPENKENNKNILPVLPKNKSGRKWTIILIIIGVTVFSAGIYSIYYLINQ